MEVVLTKDLISRLKELGPAWFILNVLNTDLWEKQKEIVEATFKHRRVAVKACHGVGKSYTCGKLVLAFLFRYYKAIVITTAPSWRQVTKLVWKEIRAAYKASSVPLGGMILPTKPELHIMRDEWYAAGISTNDPNKFQGLHEEHMLVIVDESAGVEEEMFVAIEGIITSDDTHLLMIGNPTSLSGSFFEAFKDPRTYRISISCFDTPNFTTFGITPADFENNTWEAKINGRPMPYPKLITPEWAYDKFLRWKPGSAMYQSRVLGEFPDQENDTLIPYSWIERAVARWHDLMEKENHHKWNTKEQEIGVDVARYGNDSSVIATKQGNLIHKLDELVKFNTVELSGKVLGVAQSKKTLSIKVDVIGVGSGVADIVRDAKLIYTVVADVNVAESPVETNDQDTKFANKRASLYWALREALDPKNPDALALPDDDELIQELSSTRFKFNSKGKILIEEKDALKSRIGRSPDRADAVMLANAPLELLGLRKPTLIVGVGGTGKSSRWR
jgi:hypothetical protein